MYFARQENTCAMDDWSLGATKHDISSFFQEFLSKKVYLDGLQLGNTFVGKSKDNLDPVAPDLVAADVIHTLEPKSKKDVLRNDVIGQLKGRIYASQKL